MEEGIRGKVKEGTGREGEMWERRKELQGKGEERRDTATLDMWAGKGEK